jgi:hypothetical protein
VNPLSERAFAAKSPFCNKEKKRKKKKLKEEEEKKCKDRFLFVISTYSRVSQIAQIAACLD